MENTISLKKLRLNIADTAFLKHYGQLMLGETMSDEERYAIIKMALIFLNYGSLELEQLAYRIFIRFATALNDSRPLYRYALVKDFIPIIKCIERNSLVNRRKGDSFTALFAEAYEENFKQDNIYLSLGQKEIIAFASKTQGSFAIVAPTSYGKSELIVSQVKANLGKKQCIVVPTKALLAQTRKRIMNDSELAKKVKRVITHPDMWPKKDELCVAVLTQERFLRLLQKNPSIYFDIVLVDEAHNILSSDERWELLAQVLIILKKRNQRTKYCFFTPFLASTESILIPQIEQLESKKVSEQIKIERYFVCDLRSNEKKLRMYDQFINKFLTVEDVKYENDIALVEHYSAGKNIIYLNKTKDLESVAVGLAESHKSKSINKDPDIEEVCNAIGDYLHADYKLIKCLRKGVLYHHGIMPDIVRLYVEHVFSNNEKVKYIVTSSTLLEGVNIPAEKMFILDNRIGRGTFTPTQFKNLTGRVCRFSELFDVAEDNLRMLEPCIYLVNGGYTRQNTNLESFMETRANLSKEVSDDKENVLLYEESELPEEKKVQLKNSLEYLENIEPNSVQGNGYRYVESEIAKSCFRNNVKEFDIHINEGMLVSLFDEINKTNLIKTADEIIKEISRLFIPLLHKKTNDNSLFRLKELSAQSFYSMFLSWRMDGSSYNKMVGKFLKYWEEIKEPLVYVGFKWGEVKRLDTDVRPLYVDIKRKTNAERVNIAILRIKEEQDFIDNMLMKYVEILNDLGRLETSLYEKIKYGTGDPNMICLLKNGYSIDLARCVLQEKYKAYITIDLVNEDVLLKEQIIDEMERNEENNLLIFETGYHLH